METFLNNITIPALDENKRKVVYEKWLKKNEKSENLGLFEEITANISAMTGKEPFIAKKAMILTAGDHGIAKYGVSNFPQEVTIQMIQGYLRGKAGANVLADHAGIKYEDLFVVDIGVAFDLEPHQKLINKKVAYGTDDFSIGPAMTRENAALSVKAGFDVAIDCINNGYEMIVLSEMGIGNTTSSAAIASVFTGLDPINTVGRGTGIGDKRLVVKRDVVTKALEVNKPDKNDAIDILSKVGGYELGGLAGVILAGASRRVPIFVDGINATAAALIAFGINKNTKNYMLPSHLSAEIAHKKMLEILELTPILTANMRLGEGTGASVVISLLDAVIDVYNNITEGLYE